METDAPQTEMVLPDAAGIDTWDDLRILDFLAAGQERAIAAVRAAAPKIADAANVVAERVAAGGRLIYAGAGTSIRIGVQDGSELPETFGLAERQLCYLIAGGPKALTGAAGPREDDEAAGRRDAAISTAADVVIAIAASGTTPYTLAAAREAKGRGAAVIAMVNNPGSPLGALGDVEIVLNSGPEAIAGSTRMGAGTAQKAALNLLTTLTFIKRGAVHDGMMVNVEAGNAKLKRRAAAIVSRIADVDTAAATAALDLAHGQIKPAVLMCAGAKDYGAARRCLDGTGGNLRLAMRQLAAS
jgi:N-acetylmuramic acid 6-phosphate etherase